MIQVVQNMMEMMLQAVAYNYMLGKQRKWKQLLMDSNEG